MQAKCFGGCCPKNCWASYKLHEDVTQKLSDVNDLISNGHFDVVAEKFVRDQFDEVPVDRAVGVESTFEELRSCFENSLVRVIVIQIEASKDVDPGKIQEDIRKKLRIGDDAWNNKTVDDRARLFYNILKNKKFALLVDDVWEKIDLLKLGVHSPNNHECKIIFTTRSKEISGQMVAWKSIKVNCLTLDKAFDLFKEKVGKTTLENFHILPLAKLVVEERRGLPLALYTIGCAMANKVTPNEWKHAIEILRSYPSKVQGIVEDVYYLLEFSYDRLPDDIYKSCFSYCALFPEDYNFEKQKLILLWIAEGFFG
ncbi:probable disease resistance protein At1g61180 [Neltuma alba]|uniref:probable disease resistance protein At1g61180 n=1 Tax=Neltuma alba TaxID=207710 RepID=UPI0010A305E7|nr:probable disease resistance protein At1g61180 [Prosopis alba]